MFMLGCLVCLIGILSIFIGVWLGDKMDKIEQRCIRVEKDIIETKKIVRKI